MKLTTALLSSILVASMSFVATPINARPSSSSSSTKYSIVEDSSATSVNTDKYSFTYSDELYQPFEVTDSIYINGSYKYNSSYSLSGCRPAVKFYCSAFSSDTAYKTTFGSTFDLTQGYSYSYNYQVTNVKSYLKYGIKCELGIWSTSLNKFLNPTHIYLYSKSYDKIDPSLYKTTEYGSRNSCRGNGQIVFETFLFDNFRNYIDADIYNTLSLEDFSFKYSYPLSLTYASAYLDIEDTNNLFPLIPIYDGYRRIPIQFVQNNRQIGFSFPSTMYVNPETMEMSLTKQNSSVETRNFYMPKNKKSLSQSLKMILRADGIGANKISFEYPIEFNSGNNFIGDCDDSDYCVIGGMKK